MNACIHGVDLFFREYQLIYPTLPFRSIYIIFELEGWRHFIANVLFQRSGIARERHPGEAHHEKNARSNR